MGHLMHQIKQGKGVDELDNGELHRLIWLVEEKMEEMRKYIEFFHLLPHKDPTAQTVDSGHKSLMLIQWFTNMINNNEHTFGDIVAQDNLRLLPERTLGGKFDVGVPLYRDLRGTTTNMGQQLWVLILSVVVQLKWDCLM
ncbi:MADS-box transcription factor PHERES 1-like [Gossypium australe]|uniref:MADS-box transcription factor PHERES 1-like n=1 Tax=Gossypium australe TaxID=47621 RepID=A0A5B6VS42_9ROSI|nr:MADS-box transcription factor PHERES 1-like [Gossypium australe]